MTEKVANAVGGPLYPIREVSRLTGVNSVTLRAWERRYGLIQPRRTPKGHRLYAREDIERVERILQWLNRGVPVSQVGELLDQASGSSDAATPEDSAQSSVAEDTAPDHDWEGQRLEVIDAVAEFDTNRLENLFTRSMGLYPVNTAISRLWQPVVERLENVWKDHSTPMAQRCFLESFLRTRLGLRLYHGNHENTEPRILMSYLPGGCGALWQLLFAFTASSAGFYITLFDGPVPVGELIEAARQKDARTIVLSGAMEADIEGLRRQLSQAAYQGILPIRVSGSVTRQLRDTDEENLSALDNDPGRAIAQLRLATARHG
ncbi:MerR family transcriptional regulator [Kushneria indalinina]|uniref:MerR family transcriptional regulator n=1 Tax=Kushneria indalinina DSM 14324 TaxID=1122140 RepID=A0A3D9DTE4_9GAMM|nr:MerR family transcriptional regulator [Kushneria indalinina]REC93925.1 MerR family transcriptional regulator [Kushneria indalinina DSM 14324]